MNYPFRNYSNSPHCSQTPQALRYKHISLEPPSTTGITSLEELLEHWEYDFVRACACRAETFHATQRDLNEWAFQLTKTRFQKLRLELNENNDLACRWKAYYKKHLVYWFPISYEVTRQANRRREAMQALSIQEEEDRHVTANAQFYSGPLVDNRRTRQPEQDVLLHQDRYDTPPPRYSATPPIQIGCDENGRPYDPDVIYGASLLYKMKHGIRP